MHMLLNLIKAKKLNMIWIFATNTNVTSANISQTT